MRGKRHQAAALIAEQAHLQLAVPLLAESESDRLGAKRLAAQQPHLLLQQRRLGRGVVNDAKQDAEAQRRAAATSSAFGASSVLHQRDLHSLGVSAQVPALAAAARAMQQQHALAEAAAHAAARAALPVMKKRARRLPLPNNPKKAISTATAATAPGVFPRGAATDTVATSAEAVAAAGKVNALAALSGLYNSDEDSD
jgi:hypothetical protein